MFTQKKKNYKTAIYTAIVITLCLLIVALAWPKDETGSIQAGSQTKISDEKKTNINNQTQQNNNTNEEEWEDEPLDNPTDENDENDENDNINHENPIEKPDISGNQDSYYLVKHSDGQIKVFFVDTAGNEIELESTQILYEMLGPEDQSLFDNGYKVKNQEELAVLLQDFES